MCPFGLDHPNQRLSPLENRIGSAFAEGYEAVVKLPKFDIFRWLAKIYLGTQCKEIALLADRSTPPTGSILQPEFVKRYAILHFWLQMASCTNKPEYCPGSLWIFRAQIPTDISLQFDLMDDVNNGVIGIRAGDVAVIADFLENGVHEQVTKDRYEYLTNIPLHPQQFTELMAMIIYEASLLCQRSEVEFFEIDDKLGYHINWWSTVEGDATMKPWIKSDYAHILSFYTNIPSEKLYFPPDLLLSWLHDPYGNFVYWPLGDMHPFAGQSPDNNLST